MTFADPLRRMLFVFAGLLALVAPALAAPFVQGITPEFGPPGTQVRIIGSGLRPLGDTPSVYFGASVSDKATLVSANDLEIIAVVPASAKVGPITVQNVGGTYTTPFFFYPAPRIEFFGTEFSDLGVPPFKIPVIASAGPILYIQGENFTWPGSRGILVRVGATALSASATAATQILANVPPLLETGFVSVVTDAGVTTNTTQYVYGPPRISGFTPKAGAGETVEIRGINFLTLAPFRLEVRLGGIQATSVDVRSNTNLFAVVPPDVQTGPVTVAAPGGSFITTSNFVVLPTVASFSPKSGGAGTVVTLLGSGLTGTKSVLFGTTPALASAIINRSASQVDVGAPVGVTSGKITVITDAGTNTTTELFYAAPKINDFTPGNGDPGTLVTVSGVNFLGTTAVQLNGGAVPQFAVVDNAKLTFQVPAGATSGRIKVIAPGGTNESTGSFLVQGPQPVISSFSPKFGPAGTKVTIQGQNLSTVTAVSFNGAAAAFTLSAVALEATVPAGATTGKIRVTSPDGAVDTTENFIVGSTADLRLVFSASANPAVAFGPVTFNVQGANSGPLAAQATVFAVELPAGLVFLEAASPNAPFTVEGNTVRFNYGTMNPGSIFTGSVKANAGEATNRVVVARATSTTPESAPADNVKQIDLVVALPAMSVEQISANELLLSWASAAGGLYSPFAASKLTGPWDVAPGNPVNDGSTIQLIVPLSGTAQYYGLQLKSP